MSEADKNRLSTFFAIALKHAQGMWNDAVLYLSQIYYRNEVIHDAQNQR